jgi:acyl-CoA thioesterase-1
LPVVNLARPGATLKSGLVQARGISETDAVVLIELGGNDLLANTESGAFARQLDELLAAVCRPGDCVAMFELPLPPLYNAFGAAQRTLAAKHGVTLIPKRYLTAALGCKGGTIDGLHLSERGHRALAEAIAGILQPEP